ncbi:4-hydroxy-tetrahydrodipicolinate reductase [Candidatus Pantoea edessiphila]|uniref:4-hydroxy-tetrahydrodipicolinate reductase n=1 Tax=Candidatus Pantoea edessiphila TaxID=2044610 RepID=A0A2P5SW92_9GAMM|nr:4-hydroxy-tetrahydrodipicolinate reductase [Candidatus Pantoea edessiphila]PPI86583.1 4-hydroxy-tetrahydrodipicolinate reductase [Candidatus Pantoea edessiphila]
MNQIRVAIAGAQGRMGRELIKAANKEDINLSSVLVKAGSSMVGCDAGILINSSQINITITDNIHNIIDSFDLLIDFTTPQSTMEYLSLCKQHKKSMVIGTTGFNQKEYKLIDLASKEIAIVLSANFSIGMNVVLKLLEATSKIIGNDSDIEIIEAHHRNKIDAPSGTALSMGKIIANTMHWKFDESAVYKREGIIGKRKEQSIGFSTIRGGDIIGEHKAIFASIGEQIEITHKVSNRMNFALGAIKATKWLKHKKSGLFNMWDVLGLSSL